MASGFTPREILARPVTLPTVSTASNPDPTHFVKSLAAYLCLASSAPLEGVDDPNMAVEAAGGSQGFRAGRADAPAGRVQLYRPVLRRHAVHLSADPPSLRLKGPSCPS